LIRIRWRIIGILRVILRKRGSPICLELYSNSKFKKQLECGHCFCTSCISHAIEIKPYCPLCRHLISNYNNNNNSNNINSNTNYNQNNNDGYQAQVNTGTYQTDTNNVVSLNVQPNLVINTGTRFVYNPGLQFNDWNINIVRHHFSTNPFFINNQTNWFASDMFLLRARERWNVFRFDPYFRYETNFGHDYFFNKHYGVFMNDPFIHGNLGFFHHDRFGGGPRMEHHNNNNFGGEHHNNNNFGGEHHNQVSINHNSNIGGHHGGVISGGEHHGGGGISGGEHHGGGGHHGGGMFSGGGHHGGGHHR